MRNRQNNRVIEIIYSANVAREHVHINSTVEQWMGLYKHDSFVYESYSTLYSTYIHRWSHAYIGNMDVRMKNRTRTTFLSNERGACSAWVSNSRTDRIQGVQRISTVWVCEYNRRSGSIACEPNCILCGMRMMRWNIRVGASNCRVQEERNYKGDRKSKRERTTYKRCACNLRYRYWLQKSKKSIRWTRWRCRRTVSSSLQLRLKAQTYFWCCIRRFLEFRLLIISLGHSPVRKKTRWATESPYPRKINWTTCCCVRSKHFWTKMIKRLHRRLIWSRWWLHRTVADKSPTSCPLRCRPFSKWPTRHFPLATRRIASGRIRSQWNSINRWRRDQRAWISASRRSRMPSTSRGRWRQWRQRRHRPRRPSRVPWHRCYRRTTLNSCATRPCWPNRPITFCINTCSWTTNSWAPKRPFLAYRSNSTFVICWLPPQVRRYWCRPWRQVRLAHHLVRPICRLPQCRMRTQPPTGQQPIACRSTRDRISCRSHSTPIAEWCGRAWRARARWEAVIRKISNKYGWTILLRRTFCRKRNLI